MLTEHSTPIYRGKEHDLQENKIDKIHLYIFVRDFCLFLNQINNGVSKQRF